MVKSQESRELYGSGILILMNEEERIKYDAEIYARENKKRLAREKTSKEIFPPEDNPVSVFMAGSPGAGKTEASKNLLKRFSKENSSVIRIDPDELRECFKEYIGSYSSLFQSAVSIIAECILDCATENKQSFIFDSTLTNLEKSKSNISRSIKRKRFVQILYIYQDPLQAWEFVKDREVLEGRNIPKDRFIDQYFIARENVNILKKEYGREIQVDLIVKNIDGTDQLYQENIDNIDFHVKEEYTREILETLLQ